MRKIFLLSLVVILPMVVMAQKQDRPKGRLSGNFNMEAWYYLKDSVIGTKVPPEKTLMNGYANFRYDYGNFTAGMRFEGYLNTLQGFEKGYDGTGIPYRFLSYKNKELEFTVGNFYDQFGNGLVLRAWEDKNLGYDNAFEGIHVKYNPYKGVYFKGLYGRQRVFFDLGEGIVRGFDGEININQLFDTLKYAKTRFIIGGSIVSKYQKDENVQYNLPENVASFAGRFNFQHGMFSVKGEYAHKVNDPSADNGMIYKDGDALLVNSTWSKGSFGAMLSGKWVDNMSFRSDYQAVDKNLLINYLPAVTQNHTYALTAMYPYATQLTGEAGAQGEFYYRIKRKTALGGKYGTLITLNYSRVHDIERNTEGLDNDTLGYKDKFLAISDDLLYDDFNLKIERKFSRKFKGVLIGQYVSYNKQFIEGKGGVVYAKTGVLDLSYRIKRRHTLRLEQQILMTEQDRGDWYSVMLEYTISPHWFFSVMDQYNYGNDHKDLRVHYYTLSMGYNKGGNRVQLNFGKQREGIVCVGGVCRQVPSAYGAYVTLTSTF
ncbi:DUF6029 family protein [Salinivirga cyanobacteriivorans]